MGVNLKNISVLLLCVLKVSSMAIKGPALTRYDPCGLGVIHFDKLTEKFWEGVVNLGLYNNLSDKVTIDIHFEKQVRVYGASQNSSFTEKDNWHNIIFQPTGVPARYVFYIQIEKNETEIPTVLRFALNNVTLCDDAIKLCMSHTIFKVIADAGESFGQMRIPIEINQDRMAKRAGHECQHYAIYVVTCKTLTHYALRNIGDKSEKMPDCAVSNYRNKSSEASQTIASLNVTDDAMYYKHVCGRRSLSHAELTTVSTESQAGDWPWHIALLVKDPVSNVTRYECGGNIISRTAIVTAGHCVSRNGIMVDTNRIVIVAGVSNYKDFKQVGRQEFIAEKVILHPNYDDVHATADLAVIKISNLRFTEYVQPICIWGPVYDKSNLFGYRATVVGFGTTEHNKPSNVLRSTYTLVQNDTTCLNSSPKLYTKLLNEFTFCAGFGPTSGINPRNGDSGGGLVVPTMQLDHKISWFLRGVLSKCGVSAGQKECNPKYYVVYTDVGPHYGWIYHHSGLQFRNNIM